MNKLIESHVIEYLKDNSIQSLKDDFSIVIKEYDDLGLYVLNYNQISSPRNHSIADECRGMVIDKNLNIVRRGFKRFYNLGELENDKTFDFNNCVIHPKEDGSLILISYFDCTKKWEIGTRGICFGENTNNYNNETYRNMVLGAMQLNEEEFQCNMERYCSKFMTYLFEFTSPKNRIVTPYYDDLLFLIGVCDNKSGEIKHPSALSNGVPFKHKIVETLKFESLDKLKENIEKLEGFKEGFVLVDYEKNERIKVKSQAYLTMHCIRGDGLTINRINELILINEHHEYIAIFPEDKKLFDPSIDAFERLKASLLNTYEKYKNIEVQKDFAITIANEPLKSVFFDARSKKICAESAFNNLALPKKVSLLENFNK